MALFAAVALALATRAPAGPGGLPDLVADSPGDGTLEIFSSGLNTRLLLRFDAYVHNRGQAPLEMLGSARTGNRMGQVTQEIQGSPVSSSARITFEPEDGHAHWHLANAARYSLWNAFKTAEEAPGMKVGFCLEDTQPIESYATFPPVYTDEAIGFCQSGNPGASSVLMGISAGWRDIYGRHLAFQWVDVSDVRPGIYWLRAEVDPDRVIRESDETNTPSFGANPSVVPGYVAQPVAQAITSGRTATIALRASSVGGVGPLQFRVDAAPRCGNLDRPVGVWLDGGPSNTRAGPGAPDPTAFSTRRATPTARSR